MDDIPSDLVYFIAVKLSLPWVLNLSVTCRALYRLLDVDTFWLHYVVARIPLRHENALIHNIAHHNGKPWRYYWRLRGSTETTSMTSMYQNGIKENRGTLFYSKRIYLTSERDLYMSKSNNLIENNVSSVNASIINNINDALCIFVTLQGEIYLTVHIDRNDTTISPERVVYNPPPGETQPKFVDATALTPDLQLRNGVLFAIDSLGRLYCTKRLRTVVPEEKQIVIDQRGAAHGHKRKRRDEKVGCDGKVGCDEKVGCDGKKGPSGPRVMRGPRRILQTIDLNNIEKTLFLIDNGPYLSFGKGDKQEDIITLIRYDGSVLVARIDRNKLSFVYIFNLSRPVVSLTQHGNNRIALAVEDYNNPNIAIIKTSCGRSLANISLLGVRRVFYSARDRFQLCVITTTGKAFQLKNENIFQNINTCPSIHEKKFISLENDGGYIRGILMNKEKIKAIKNT